MKTKDALLSTVLVFVLALTVLGQTPQKAKTKAVIKENEFTRVMGKPTYESKVDSLNMEVWVMTQAQHKKMMNGKMGLMMRREMEGLRKHPMMGRMSDSSMGMDMATRKAMMEGTHFIMLNATNTSFFERQGARKMAHHSFQIDGNSLLGWVHNLNLGTGVGNFPSG